MLLQEEKKELLQQLREKQDAISKLRGDLKEVNERKEKYFQEKEALNKKIASLIKTIQSTRSERNTRTAIVKNSKSKRSEINKEMKEISDEIAKLQEEKQRVMKQKKFKEDPLRIKKKIEAIEHQVETEGMPFSKEKKMMTVVKDLKKQLKDAEELLTIVKKLHKKRTAFSKLQMEGRSAHKHVQNTAKESQTFHKDVVITSKEIEELRKEEREIFAKFILEKNMYLEINRKFHALQQEAVPLKEKLNLDKQDFKQKQENATKEKLRQTADQVEDKIKKGKKLTTEDLIAFQGAV